MSEKELRVHSRLHERCQSHNRIVGKKIFSAAVRCLLYAESSSLTISSTECFRYNQTTADCLLLRP
jgi:hypothetical protein